MIHKIRPNVIILAVIAALLAGFFAVLLKGVVIGPADNIFALLVGTGIGSLLTLAGQVAADPPPPTVPADVHERIVEGAYQRRGKRPSEE